MRQRRWQVWALGACTIIMIGIALVLISAHTSSQDVKKVTVIAGIVLNLGGVASGMVSAVFAWLSWRKQPPTNAGGDTMDGQSLSAPKASQHATNGADTQEFEDWRRHATVDHGRLFGASTSIGQLASWLSNPNGDWIISIFGSGGAGKTTLAYEAVKSHAKEAGFQRIAWVSAKFQHLDLLGQLEESERLVHDWRDLLVSAAKQLRLGVDLNPSLIELQFADGLERIGKTSQCLIVLDNLETVRDARFAIRFLEGRALIRPHKVMITTRHSAIPFARNVQEMRWNGLSASAARQFAEHLLNPYSGVRLTDDDLNTIVAVTGGNPLLLQLTAKRLAFDSVPVEQVISDISDVSSVVGATIASYLFATSLSTLASRVTEDIAAQLMATFCCKPTGGIFGHDELFTLSGIQPRSAFEEARSTACQLALLQSLDGNTRTTIHPLLREFVCATGGGI